MQLEALNGRVGLSGLRKEVEQEGERKNKAVSVCGKFGFWRFHKEGFSGQMCDMEGVNLENLSAMRQQKIVCFCFFVED